MKERKRENKQHKAQTNKPSSEATLLPLWRGIHDEILGGPAALRWRKGTLSHSFKSACNFKFRQVQKSVFAHAIQGNWDLGGRLPFNGEKMSLDTPHNERATNSIGHSRLSYFLIYDWGWLPYMTSELGGGGGYQKADKRERGCVFLYVKRGAWGPKNPKFLWMSYK